MMRLRKRDPTPLVPQSIHANTMAPRRSRRLDHHRQPDVQEQARRDLQAWPEPELALLGVQGRALGLHLAEVQFRVAGAGEVLSVRRFLLARRPGIWERASYSPPRITEGISKQESLSSISIL